MSGHDLSLDDGMIVWGEALDIWAQLVTNHANGGSLTNLGGGCGNGGNQVANAPATGMNQVHCSVTGLSATALLTIFNLTSAPATVPCGTCAWLPFAAAGDGADHFVPKRDRLVLHSVSVVVDRRAVRDTVDDVRPGEFTVCAAAGFALTDRVLHTIGQ